jgi:hypothetical protein
MKINLIIQLEAEETENAINFTIPELNEILDYDCEITTD